MEETRGFFFLNFFFRADFEAKPLDDDFTELHRDQILSFLSVDSLESCLQLLLFFFHFFVFSVLTHSAIRCFFLLLFLVTLLPLGISEFPDIKSLASFMPN